MLTIQGLGQDTGSRCLPYSSGASEEIGVGNPLLFDGVHQRGGYMLLGYYLIELLWTPFTG